MGMSGIGNPPSVMSNALLLVGAAKATARGPPRVPVGAGRAGAGMAPMAGGGDSAVAAIRAGSRVSWIRDELWLTTSIALLVVLGVRVRLGKVSVRSTVVRSSSTRTSLTVRLNNSAALIV